MLSLLEIRHGPIYFRPPGSMDTSEKPLNAERVLFEAHCLFKHYETDI
jgi:hypothetical protein